MNLRGLGLCGKLGPVLRTPRLPSPTDTPSAQSYGHPVCPVLRTPRLPSPTDTPSAQSYGHPVCPVLRTPRLPSPTDTPAAKHPGRHPIVDERKCVCSNSLPTSFCAPGWPQVAWRCLVLYLLGKSCCQTRSQRCMRRLLSTGSALHK